MSMACETGLEIREFLLHNRLDLYRIADQGSEEFLRLANEQQRAFDQWRLHVAKCSTCSSDDNAAIVREMMRGLDGDPPGMGMEFEYPWHPDMEDIESEAD